MVEFLLFKAVLWGSAVLIILISGSFLMFIKFEREKVKSIKEKAMRELEFQREMRLAEIEIGDEIKSQIARELHDNIGHSLALMRAVYEQLINNTKANSDRYLVELDRLIVDSSNEVRNISRALNADYLNATNFLLIIQIEMERLARIYPNISILFSTGELMVNRYSDDQLLMAYRIFQEAITNAIKHSNAKQIVVNCLQDNKLFRIKDDGKGFENVGLETNTNGLKNMVKRAELADLVLTIDSKSGEGTEICIE